MTKLQSSLKQIIRVNHAGEYGAQKIYNGQIKFCKNRKLKKKLERNTILLIYFFFDGI